MICPQPFLWEACDECCVHVDNDQSASLLLGVQEEDLVTWQHLSTSFLLSVCCCFLLLFVIILKAGQNVAGGRRNGLFRDGQQSFPIGISD